MTFVRRLNLTSLLRLLTSSLHERLDSVGAYEASLDRHFRSSRRCPFTTAKFIVSLAIVGLLTNPFRILALAGWLCCCSVDQGCIAKTPIPFHDGLGLGPIVSTLSSGLSLSAITHQSCPRPLLHPFESDLLLLPPYLQNVNKDSGRSKCPKR